MRETRTSGSVRDGAGNVPIYSALCMNQTFGFLLEPSVGGIAIAQEYRAGLQRAQELADMEGASGIGIGKADLLTFPQDRPEIALVHLALARPPRFDGSLVQSQHACSYFDDD